MTAITSSDVGSMTKTGIKAAIRACTTPLLLSLALMVIGAGYGRYRFGTLSATLAYLHGERILVDDPSQSFDGTHAGGHVVVRYALTNLSGRPVNIIGMTCSCTCTIVEDMPKSLGTLETKVVSARVNLSEGKTDVSGSIRLYTDEPHSPEISLTFSVRATPSNGSGVPRVQ